MMGEPNSVHNAPDMAIIRMNDGLPPRLQRHSVAFQAPSLRRLASTPTTPAGYSFGIGPALSLRRSTSASSIHLAVARAEIRRSCKHPPPAPLPSSPVFRPAATRHPTVSGHAWPTCEYNKHVAELENIRCVLDNHMRERPLYREAAKSGYRRLNFLLAKIAKDNDPHLLGLTRQAMDIATSSKSQLETLQHKILEIKARERGAIAAVRDICIALSILKN